MKKFFTLMLITLMVVSCEKDEKVDSSFNYDIDLISGRYVVDAKSIMGIFSLDLSKPIDLNIHAEDNIDEVLAVLKPYMI